MEFRALRAPAYQSPAAPWPACGGAGAPRTAALDTAWTGGVTCLQRVFYVCINGMHYRMHSCLLSFKRQANSR